MIDTFKLELSKQIEELVLQGYNCKELIEKAKKLVDDPIYSEWGKLNDNIANIEKRS